MLCFVWAIVCFCLHFLSKESSLFQLFFCFRVGEQDEALMPWRLGRIFWGRGLCILYDVIYSPGEGTLDRTYQCQATFSAWYEDENDMRISQHLLSFCQYLRLLLYPTGYWDLKGDLVQFAFLRKNETNKNGRDDIFCHRSRRMMKYSLYENDVEHLSCILKLLQKQKYYIIYLYS